MKKINQVKVIENILEGEQLNISELARNVEVNRGNISRLLNHNVQLSDEHLKKIKDCYSEYFDENEEEFEEVVHVKKVSNSELAKKILAKKLEKRLNSDALPIKVEVRTAEEQLKLEDEFESTIDEKYPPAADFKLPTITVDKEFDFKALEQNKKQQSLDEIKNNSGAAEISGYAYKDAEPKILKVKEENRHRNLNCPESGYHMKVPYRDLMRARPLCPITQLPMMLKEEIRQYKKLDEAGKKSFVASLKGAINLLTKESGSDNE